MMDTHVRHPHDPPPLRPDMLLGARNPNKPETDWSRRRYARLHEGEDARRIRVEVQEEGRGLYVFELHDGCKALVEAYYPDELSPRWIRKELDPLRMMDMKMGRLTVVNEELVYIGSLNPKVLLRIRKNNRNAHKHLKRHLSSHDRVLAKREAKERAEKEDWEHAKGDEWCDMYVDAHMEAMKFARGNPRVASTGIPTQEG